MMRNLKYHDKRKLARRALGGFCVSLLAVNLYARLRGFGGSPFPLLDYIATNKPGPLQLDIMVPVYNRDDKLLDFGQQLGEAIRKYQKQVQKDSSSIGSYIADFRLLITRYSDIEKQNSDQIRQQLSEKTSIPKQSIITIKAPEGTFERAAAVNLLQKNACSLATCLVARVDVDMEVRPVFFENSVEVVYNKRNAYFPIVWSEHYPLSAQLVEAHLQKNTSNYSFKLPEFSEHRGYWRIFGTGMYVLSGPHAKRFNLDTKFRGWGGEDGNFYQMVGSALTQYRVTRTEEPGLIHKWHPKFCRMGVDVFSEEQWKDCQGARLGQMGSDLGFQLTVKHLEENMPEEYRHHSIYF